MCFLLINKKQQQQPHGNVNQNICIGSIIDTIVQVKGHHEIRIGRDEQRGDAPSATKMLAPLHRNSRLKSAQNQIWRHLTTTQSRTNIQNGGKFANFRTDSSSFSIPLGIWGTARLMAEYSGRSGSSSAR